MEQDILESLRRILRSGYVEITSTGIHYDFVNMTRVILMHHLHGELFVAYRSAVEVLKEHLVSGRHGHLNDLAYRTRQRHGFVVGFANSAEDGDKYQKIILNLALTNRWTFSQLRIFPTCAPYVSGNCVIRGSRSTLQLTRQGFENQKLMEAGLPEDINFPENTLMLIFDKQSHITSNSELASKMFQLADRHGVNLVMVCNPKSLSAYINRILSFARAKHVAVSIWTDLDSGGKIGSQSFLTSDIPF